MSTQQISQSSQINKQKLNAEVEQQPHVLNHVERKEVADRSEFNANLYDSSKLHIQRKDRSGHLSEIKEGQDLHHVEDKQQNLRDDFDKQKFVSNKKMESISQAQNSDPNREKMLNEIEQNKFQLEHHAIDQDRSNPNLGLYNDQTQKHMMDSKNKPLSEQKAKSLTVENIKEEIKEVKMEAKKLAHEFAVETGISTHPNATKDVSTH